MCSPVPLKFITAGKPFAAKHPSANKWTLPRMPAEVSSQVRCLPIHFSTTWYVADVLFLFPQISAPVEMNIKTKSLNIILPGSLSK